MMPSGGISGSGGHASATNGDQSGGNSGFGNVSFGGAQTNWMMFGLAGAALLVVFLMVKK
tara:strand:+ start:11286 stop:11465 length:180 start_codon:yes stop_codon:yes gene_type:complete